MERGFPFFSQDDFADVLSLHALHLQRDPQIGKLNDGSVCRNVSSSGQDQPSESVVSGISGKDDADGAPDLFQTDGGIHPPDIFSDRFQRFVFIRVLVGERANNFGDQIRIGNDSGGSSEFIQKNRHADFFPFHIREQAIGANGFGYEIGGLHGGSQIGRSAAPVFFGKVIADVDNADDFVDVLMINRKARIVRMNEDSFDLFRRSIPVYRRDFRAMGHDFGGLP